MYVPSSTLAQRRHINANADDAYPLAHIVGACIGYLPREYYAFGLVMPCSTADRLLVLEPTVAVSPSSV